MSDTHITAPTQFFETGGARFAYRRWGKPPGVRWFSSSISAAAWIIGIR